MEDLAEIFNKRFDKSVVKRVVSTETGSWFSSFLEKQR